MKSIGTQELEEKEILLRCQQGDCGEYGRIAIRYRSRVMGLACKYLNDEDEAEDLSQEVFLQSLLKIHRYDISRDFKTWLCTITVRRSIDLLRRRRLFMNYLERESKQMQRDILSKRDREEHWLKIEESNLFAPLLVHLTQRQREALLLHMDKGYSTTEIAARFNCSTSTVRGYLFGARRILRRHLEKQGVGSAEYLSRLRQWDEVSQD